MIDLDFTYTTPEPLVINFDPPVKLGSAELTKLHLVEPTANAVWVAEQHLTARNGNRATRMYQKALVSKVGGVPESILDAVPISVFSRAARYLQDFIEAGVVAAGDESEEDMPRSMTIMFDPPLTVGSTTYQSLRLTEPTLGQMAKADTALGDLSAQRVRAFQESIVTLASGEPATLITQLPVSVLNRAATFVMGFSTPGRAISTSP